MAPLLLLLLFLPLSLSSPFNCTDPTRLCTSFLALRPPHPPLPLLQSLFDVLPSDLTADDSFLYVRKNCSCSSSTYLTNSTLTVASPFPVTANKAVVDAYGALAVFPNSRRQVGNGSVVNVRLVCGCSSGLWNYLVGYVVGEGESLEMLASWFGVSMDSIETVNGIQDPTDVVAGDVYFIPLDSVPGKPYTEMMAAPPAPAPTPISSPLSVMKEHHMAEFPYRWIILSVGTALVLIAVLLLLCVCCKSTFCSSNISRNLAKDPEAATSHKFQILHRPSFCYTSGGYFCFRPRRKKPSSIGDTSSHHVDIPKGMAADAFDVEKPNIFSYEEILLSTDAFSDTNLLGHGTYGSVYYGVLGDQEVAVKRMTVTKSKEFKAEMKVLCKVHHASLVELIGYAATGDELFVVYEYAQRGSLRNHLHDPQNRGHTSLSWIGRVQIALDAARGLEYIHEHTRHHYVHRDIKSSNILLDSSFRAKISDFGLAKLVATTPEGEIAATKVVGTFGYLAPEYLRDGLATTKSDVYAFGVVLFELITGKEAITRAEGIVAGNVERRSLASVMLAALKNASSSMNMASLKEHIDPNMMNLYPHDCVHKMAMLAKQCVEEDPILRPDMKQVVISLSHILLSSVEWEATLAGNSQVFSGLVQGR